MVKIQHICTLLRVLEHWNLAGQCRGKGGGISAWFFRRSTVSFVWFAKSRADTSCRVESIAFGFNFNSKILQFIITSCIPPLPQALI